MSRALHPPADALEPGLPPGAAEGRLANSSAGRARALADLHAVVPVSPGGDLCCSCRSRSPRPSCCNLPIELAHALVPAARHRSIAILAVELVGLDSMRSRVRSAGALVRPPAAHRQRDPLPAAPQHRRRARGVARAPWDPQLGEDGACRRAPLSPTPGAGQPRRRRRRGDGHRLAARADLARAPTIARASRGCGATTSTRSSVVQRSRRPCRPRVGHARVPRLLRRRGSVRLAGVRRGQTARTHALHVLVRPSAARLAPARRVGEARTRSSRSTSFAIAGSADVRLFSFVVSAGLLYGIARRLSLGPGLSAVAVVLFGLLPARPRLPADGAVRQHRDARGCSRRSSSR